MELENKIFLQKSSYNNFKTWSSKTQKHSAAGKLNSFGGIKEKELVVVVTLHGSVMMSDGWVFRHCVAYLRRGYLPQLCLSRMPSFIATPGRPVLVTWGSMSPPSPVLLTDTLTSTLSEWFVEQQLQPLAY